MTKKSESNRTFFQIHRACLRKVLPLTFALSPNRPAVPFTAIGAKKNPTYINLKDGKELLSGTFFFS